MSKLPENVFDAFKKIKELYPSAILMGDALLYNHLNVALEDPVWEFHIASKKSPNGILDKLNQRLPPVGIDEPNLSAHSLKECISPLQLLGHSVIINCLGSKAFLLDEHSEIAWSGLTWNLHIHDPSDLGDMNLIEYLYDREALHIRHIHHDGLFYRVSEKSMIDMNNKLITIDAAVFDKDIAYATETFQNAIKLARNLDFKLHENSFINVGS